MRILLSILIIFFGLTSCQKEITEDILNQDSTINPIDTTIVTNPVNGNFQVKIDGVQWVANDYIQVELLPDSGTSRVQLELSAGGTDGREFLITLNDFRIGTYQFDDSLHNLLEYVDTADVNFATGNAQGTTSPGSITITSIDTVNKIFSGTFQCTAYQFSTSDTPNVKFTEGSFTNIRYKSLSTTPTTGNDTLRVKVNDTLFNAVNITSTTVSGSIVINGSDSTTVTMVTITLPETITPGNYTFNLATRNAIYQTGNNAYFPAINSGSLQILEVNRTTNRIRGNFSFTGSTVTNPPSSRNFTEGYFSVEFP